MSRSRESFGLMDFEYDNKQGPVDVHSPFFTSTPARTRQLNPAAPSPFRSQTTPHLSRQPQQSHFGSPSKNAFATPNRLYPQSGTKPLPSIPPRSPWALRTPTTDYDASSGGETPNTPALESEQATPDTQLAGNMKMLMDSPSSKKSSRRHSIMRVFKSFGSPSPTKDKDKEKELMQLGPEVSRKRYADKTENRIAKRRSTRSDRSKKRRIPHDDEEETSDTEPNPNTALQPPTSVWHRFSTTTASFFHWIEAHPSLPAVLSYYIQFLVNTVLALLFIYGLYLVWHAVTTDIGVEASKHQSELMVEIAACVKNYRENRCEPETRVPAMEMACGNWETCMARDPRKLAQAQVGVKAVAKIVNGFFEEFSYKAIILLTILIFGGFNVSNWAFGLFRQSQAQSHSQPASQPYPDYPPQTPHRINSGNFLENGTQNWQMGYGIGNGNGIATPHGARGFLEGGQEGERGVLVHSQSTPAVMTYALEGREREREREEGKTPSRRRGFR